MNWYAAGIAALLVVLPARGATVPTGYADQPYASGLAAPTTMAFAPDGRLFVCEQAGSLRVIENGTLLATPFVTLDVESSGEGGLLGVAFDPQFAQNSWVYVYYTAKTPTLHNRVSRFTADGNVAVPGSEVVILDLDSLSAAEFHNGGALQFGNDGRLYIAVGENAKGSNAQSLTTLLGKILRIGKDGAIPNDNPFLGTTTGSNQSIWAYGLRNPFSLALQPSTGRLFINDVGFGTYEEINEGVAGANYGWPDAEGPSDNPAYVDPVYAYGTYTGGSCAITGGTFYDLAQGGFPAEHVGAYFFTDYCAGWIRKLDTESLSVSGFATGLVSPIALKVGPDGALYYLMRDASGTVRRIAYTGSGAPNISQQPSSVTVVVGQSATFKVAATGEAPLSYQWRRNGIDIAGATGTSITVSSPQLTDSGAVFDVVVSNAIDTVTSNPAVLTVTSNTRPSASFASPAIGTTYAAGDTIEFAATATDVEDGALPASAFTWWVNFHHDSHTHPAVLPFSGAKSGSFVIPTIGETSDNVFYRINLQVVDSGGLVRSLTRDVKPRKATITLASNPSGLTAKLDGVSVVTPYTFAGVVGMQRNLEAVSPQVVADSELQFASWSDGGARVHDISTPGTDTTYTATFSSQRELKIGDASVIEGSSGTRNAVFTVMLSSAAAESVTVNWATSDATALAGSDYLAVSGQLTFAPGVTSKTIVVAVLGDTVPETTETFRAGLSSAVGAVIADGTGIGTIVTDDGIATLRFGSSSYKKSESGGTVTVTVLRKDSVFGTVSIDYATTGGTATPGDDYTVTSGTLTFADGVTSATFTVPIANDFVIEPDETFTVTLGNASNGAKIGTPSTAVSTIQNDDKPGAFSFGATAYSKTEGTASATITVSRSGGLAADVAVDYATGNGTASAPADYSSASGTLIFAGGVSSMTFQVPFVNDSIIEADETVQLSLSNPTNGATLGTRPTAILTLVDNDEPGVFTFSSSTYSRAENGVTAAITVKRSSGAASGVSVSYATGGGTAAPGSDYTAASGVLNFAAGQTSSQFVINLTNDAAQEGNETIGLTLSDPTSGATLGSAASATLTILDDDD